MGVIPTKWSLVIPSFGIIVMALGLVTPWGGLRGALLHAAQFMIIIFMVIMINYIYIELFKLYSEKQLDTAENI